MPNDDAAAGPRPPLTYGSLPGDDDRVRVDDATCLKCSARHAVFYGAKSHAQDREDVPFGCLVCRNGCTALGIPELVGYRIDLVERLEGRYRRLYRRAMAPMQPSCS